LILEHTHGLTLINKQDNPKKKKTNVKEFCKGGIYEMTCIIHNNLCECVYVK